MDSRHDHQPDAHPTPSEGELRALMDQSERDLAAGHTIPAAEVLAEMDELIRRKEARRRARQA